jgi:hypothetical protein
MDKLLNIETQKNIILPSIYKVFYIRCATSIPDKLIGTDLVNHSNELNEWAKEVLSENKVKNFLNDDDFVFMMHQGYMFWYFKANGDQNPIVYAYRENNIFPEKRERFSEFIKQFF